MNLLPLALAASLPLVSIGNPTGGAGSTQFSGGTRTLHLQADISATNAGGTEKLGTPVVASPEKSAAISGLEVECDTENDVISRTLFDANNEVSVAFKTIQIHEKSEVNGFFLNLFDAAGNAETLMVIYSPLLMPGSNKPFPLNTNGGGRHIIMKARGDVVSDDDSDQVPTQVGNGAEPVEIKAGPISVRYQDGIILLDYEPYLLASLGISRREVRIPTSLKGISRAALFCSGAEYRFSEITTR